MEDLNKLKIDRGGKRGAGPLPRGGGRKRLMILLALMVAGVGGYFKYGGHLNLLRPRPEVEVGNVVTAYPSQALSLFNATGYVVPQTRADVASKATGRLQAIEVEAGSVVRKDQIIARLEDQDVVAVMERNRASVEAARAAVTEARAQLHVSQARVAEVRAEMLDAERAMTRAQAMVGKKYVTQEFYDAAQARRDKAAANVSSAEAGVAAAAASLATAEAQVTAAEAAYDEARVAVEYTLIRAPFDGVILSKHADVGDVVAPFASANQSKGAVVSMADMSTLQVEADVSESNLTKVSVGQPCEIQLDALPEQRLRGEVHAIVPTVDRAKATVLVKVKFIDPEPRILPDMSARVAFLSRSLTEEDQKPRTAVPAAAIVTHDGHSLAYRLDGDVAREVTVMAGGERLGDLVVIKAGLNPGDKVVLNPSAELRDGMRIKLPQS
ncbi:MAG TPA: efflux RND transporter periplasmic adaptor subunit [Gammaproteobacteria bacterium]|nr:efflux RND transporter periplasmic adaptor subunit [Gammaproteobacteria bacterium]